MDWVPERRDLKDALALLCLRQGLLQGCHGLPQALSLLPEASSQR